ncbi:hypothetical protein D3C74_274250 [compost metagenome]
MYKCEDCGASFDEPYILKDDGHASTAAGTIPYDKLCPVCKSDEISIVGSEPKCLTLTEGQYSTIRRWQRLLKARSEAQACNDDLSICENCGKKKRECECPEVLAFDILTELFPLKGTLE